MKSPQAGVQRPKHLIGTHCTSASRNRLLHGHVSRQIAACRHGCKLWLWWTGGVGILLGAACTADTISEWMVCVDNGAT
jgi:hypothetical protein